MIFAPGYYHIGNDGVMVGFYNNDKHNLIPNLKSEPVMNEKKSVYKSYLLRICSDETHQMRRVIVTRVNEAKEQHYFTTLDDLMIFLLQEIESPSKGELPMG